MGFLQVTRSFISNKQEEARKSFALRNEVRGVRVTL
jgi:hypothetical protein